MTARLLHLFVAALLLAACGRPAPPTPGLVHVLLPTVTPLPAASGAEAEVLHVVAAEADAVRQQDTDALAALWLADGQVVDALHTPDSASDDRAWAGWEAVQQRYLADVFPYVREAVALPRARAVVPVVTVEEDEAVVLIPGPDGRTAQDRWHLRRQGGSWAIASLTFNLTPLQ